MGRDDEKTIPGQLKAVPITKLWEVRSYFDIQLTIPEERDEVLLEDTFLKDWCSPLIKEVHLASFKSFKELATDIAFVFHSSGRKRGKNPEMQYLGEASMFLVFYVAVWTYRLMCKHKVYPNKGKDDQGDEVSILPNVTWNKYVRWGQHMLVAATGFGFEHKDIMFAHFVIFVAGFHDVGYLGGAGSKIWERIRGQPPNEQVQPVPPTGIPEAGPGRGGGRGRSRGRGAVPGGRALHRLLSSRPQLR